MVSPSLGNQLSHMIKTRIHLIAIALCGVLSGQTAAAQSPWTQGRAGFLLRASLEVIPKYSTYYFRTVENNVKPLERSLSTQTLQFYGEYGITRKTTVIAEIPFCFVHSGNVINDASTQLQRGSLRNFGNVGIAVRHNFISEKFTFSGQLRVDLPGGEVNLHTGLSTGYAEGAATALLSLGRHYGRAYWFVYGGGGARGIIKNNYIRGGGETGCKLNRHWIAVYADFLENTGSEANPGFLPNIKTALYQPDVSYWMVGAKGIFAFSRFWGTQVAIYRPVAGHLIYRQVALNAGVYFKWE